MILGARIKKVAARIAPPDTLPGQLLPAEALSVELSSVTPATVAVVPVVSTTEYVYVPLLRLLSNTWNEKVSDVAATTVFVYVNVEPTGTAAPLQGPLRST